MCFILYGVVFMGHDRHDYLINCTIYALIRYQALNIISVYKETCVRFRTNEDKKDTQDTRLPVNRSGQKKGL